MEKINRLAKYSLVATAFAIPLSISATTILYLLTAMLAILSGTWRQKSVYRNPIAIAYWVYSAVLIIGLTYTIASSHDAIKNILKHHWVFITPLLLPLITDDQWRERALNAFLIAMVIVLIAFYLHSLNLLVGTLYNHIQGMFSGHIIGNYMLAIAALIMTYRLFNKVTHPWLYAILIALIILKIVFIDDGRTGYIMVAVGMSYALHHKFGWRGLISGLIISATLFAIAYTTSNSFSSRIHQSINNEHKFYYGHTLTPTGIRIAMYQNSLKLIKEKPILGYGTGSITAAYKTLPKHDIAKTGLPYVIENSYFTLGIQFGLIGLLLLAGFIYLLWQQCGYLDQKSKFIMRGFILTFFVAALFNPFLFAFRTAHLYALMTVIMFGALPNVEFYMIGSRGQATGCRL